MTYDNVCLNEYYELRGEGRKNASQSIGVGLSYTTRTKPFNHRVFLLTITCDLNTLNNTTSSDLFSLHEEIKFD